MNSIAELPTRQEIEQAKETSRALAKYSGQDRVTMTIKSGNGDNKDIILPGHLMETLLNILTVMSQGKAVNVIPINSELTTQEAANMMNVSRPYLVKLLEQKGIPYHKVGTHRRVYLKDLLDYIHENNKARKQALDKLAALGQELGLD